MARYLKRGMDASAIKAADANVRETVESILAQVEERKEVAIRELSEKFDKWSPKEFHLSPSEVERAIAQASEGRGGQTGDVRWSAADELRLLVTHGTLHVCGWDHAEPDDETAMRALEKDLLAPE